MITDSMLKIMQQIKELDSDCEFITEEEIEKSIKECKKEDPNFEITEESIVKKNYGRPEVFAGFREWGAERVDW